MSQEELVIEKGLEALSQIATAATSQIPASAQRLSAMGNITKTVPWELVHNLKVGWEVHTIGEEEEIFPVLDITMKGELP